MLSVRHACLNFILGLVVSSAAGTACADEPWTRYAIDDSLRGADGVRLADANQDGLLDIVTGWEESGATRAYFHPGAAKAQLPWPFVDVGSSPSIEDANWVDLNSDGRLDILSSCEGKEMTLRTFIAPKQSGAMLNADAWKASVFSKSKGRTRWMFSEVLDAKATPIQIVLGSKDPRGTVSLLTLTSDDPESWQVEELATAGWIMSIFSLDLDADGDQDIFYSDRKGTEQGVYWLENSPEGWKSHLVGLFGAEVMFTSRPIKEQVGAGSQERWTVYVPVKSNRIVKLGATNGVENEWEILRELGPPATFGSAKGVASGDLDGDGTKELVFTCEGANGNKSGVGMVRFSGPKNAASYHDIGGQEGIKFDLVELIDLDADGDLDILTCEERANGRGLGVIWYANPAK